MQALKISPLKYLQVQSSTDRKPPKLMTIIYNSTSLFSLSLSSILLFYCCSISAALLST